MFAMNEILHGHLGALWLLFQAPLIGALVALAGVLAGRWLRLSLLGSAAGGIGVLVGWLILSGGPAAALNATPRELPVRLVAIALAGGLACPLAARFAPRRGAAICLVLLAAGSAWWLTGAPRRPAEFAHVGVLLAGLLLAMFLAMFLGGRHIARGGTWRLVLGAISLAGALWVAKAPPIWLLLALAPALVSLVQLAAPAGTELILLPVAIDLLATAMAAMLAAGRLPRLGINAIDVAVAAPFLAVLLAPRLRLPAPAGAILAGAIPIFLAWAARMWLPA